MSWYGGTVTDRGAELVSHLLAGEAMEITKIEVGSGCPDDSLTLDEIEAMTGLVNYVEDGTSDTPVVKDGVMSMTVEYRNDLNGDGLQEGFTLSEFGIYAKTENMDEVLFYYATLGDYAQPVYPYVDSRVDIRRYPITITLGVDAEVKISYSANSYVTYGDVEEIAEREVLGNLNETIVLEIAIPADGWEDTGEENWPCQNDVENGEILESQVPTVSIHLGSLKAADAAGLCPLARTLDGSIRFRAEKAPEEDLEATVLLTPPNPKTD